MSASHASDLTKTTFKILSYIIPDKAVPSVYMLGPLICSVVIGHVDGSNDIHLNQWNTLTQFPSLLELASQKLSPLLAQRH